MYYNNVLMMAPMVLSCRTLLSPRANRNRAPPGLLTTTHMRLGTSVNKGPVQIEQVSPKRKPLAKHQTQPALQKAHTRHHRLLPSGHPPKHKQHTLDPLAGRA